MNKKRKGDERMYEVDGVLYDIDEETQEEREERRYRDNHLDEFELKDIERKDEGVNYG